MPHMEGIFINGEKAKFHPEDILDTDASQYTEEIGESVTAYLTEHITNPSNPPIDTSLSIAGAAADAKKTGDELETLKSELEVTSSYNITWSQGGINNSGTAVSRTNRIRTDYIVIENDSISVEIPSGFKYAIHAYTASKTRIGYIPDGSDIMTDRKATYKVSDSYANAVYFRMWVAYADDSDILPAEGANVTVAPYESVIDTLKSHVLKSVRILGVGNSYTRDSIRWLCKILKESGYEDVVIGHGYLGASTLAEQYASLDSSDSNHSAFEYWKYTNNKNAVKTSGKTLDEIFVDEPWDIVVFQQQSDESGQYASYDSSSFDINDFITYISGKVSNADLKFALMMPWSHADGYTSTKFAEYYNSDPRAMLDAIKTVIPQVADHMSQCDYVVNAGEAIDLGRQNSYLNALGDQMLRTDKNHLYYGIPSYMVGLVYALTLCDVNLNNVMWYPTATDEEQTGITASGYLAYLAKQCAFTAVNGYALADDINAKSEQIATNTQDITELKSELKQMLVVGSVNLIPPNYEDGFITSTGSYSSPANSCRSKNFIDISGITAVSYMIGNSYSAIRLAFYDSTQTFLSRVTISDSSSTLSVPSGAKFFKMCLDACDAATALTKNIGINAGETRKDYTPYNPETQLNDSVVINGVHKHGGIKWCAMGDSITQGTYSDSQGAHVVPSQTWVAIVSELCQYDTVNKGIGGTGWVKKGAQDDKKNAREQVADIDFANYDLVTLSFGVNDWKGGVTWGTMDDSPSLGGTIYSNMKYVIEKIITDNPYAKVIVITPLNCRQGKAELATEATNYAIGYDYDGHTLQDMFDLEKQVCEYYGIQYIDMTHTSIINRVNMVTAVPDYVHPSLDAHRCIAYQTANSLMYNN